MKYRPDIDGLRAVAVASVTIYHVNAQWLPGGFAGVDVFFAISGFVVSASMAHSSQHQLGGFAAEFYSRRLARIAPALVVMLTLTAIVSTLFIPHAWLSGFSETTALYAFFGLSNWALQHNADTYFGPRADFNPYIHTWTLGAEEQFYVIGPLLLFLWVRARASSRLREAWMPVGALTLAGVASLAGCVWATRAQPAAAFYSIQFRFWELAAGALLFQLSTLRSSGSPRPARRLGVYEPWVGMALVGAVIGFATPIHFPYPWAMVVVAGTLLLIGGVDAPTVHPFRRFLARPTMVWIGKRSYSVYLWHWPIFVLMRWTIGFDSAFARLAGVLATVLAASASYRWLETPLRHNSVLHRFQPPARILVILLLIVVARDGVQRVFRHNTAISLSTVSRNPQDWYAGARMPFPDTLLRVCAVELGSRELAGGHVFTYRPTKCQVPREPRTMSVLGDSHAVVYLPMLEELSAELGITVSVYDFQGCPYLDLLMPMSEGKADGCAAFFEAASREAVSAANRGDFVFLPSLRQWRFGDHWAGFDNLNVDSLMHSSEAKKHIDESTLDAVTRLRPFTGKGMVVIFAAPPPLFRSPPFRCSDRFNVGNPICRGGLTQPRSYLQDLREPIIAAMRDVTAELPGVHIWDPFVSLCPTETCAAFRNGRPLFFDGDHLSAYGNAVVYPSFRTTIAALEAKP